MFRLPLCFLLVSLLSVVVGLPEICQTALDCSLNGDCIKGICLCDAAWKGSPKCDILSLEPTPVDAGYHNSTQASWGSNVVLVDGVYHMFAAQFANSCPLGQWGSTSMIIRAESSSPMGPFVYKETVVPVFSHNPTIRKGFDGYYYLYMIGDGTHSGTVPDCTNSSSEAAISRRMRGVDGTKEIKAADATPSESGPVSSSIHVTRAPTVFGPWSDIQQINFTDTSEYLCGGHTNPTPHFNPDGSVYLAFQAGPCDSALRPHAVGNELVGISVSDGWKGPFKLLSPNPITPFNYSEIHPVCLGGVDEDPFLWRSSRGFHIITHGMCPSGVRQAHYKFSLDGITWFTSKVQTYHYTVKYSDGSNHTFARVERPQLFFADRNPLTGYYSNPLVLYNAVCGTGSNMSDFECVFDQLTGMTWSLARPISN